MVKLEFEGKKLTVNSPNDPLTFGNCDVANVLGVQDVAELITLVS